VTAALEVSNLTVRFGHFTAVDGVSLHLAPGTRHALIGPNGAGKTSLVHAITGNVPVAGGTVHVDGTVVTRMTQAARVRMGLARTFQINQLFRGLTVLDNVRLTIFEREQKTRVFWRSARADRAVDTEARELLAFVHLEKYSDHVVHALPYGIQRLLEIAIALATKPRVLVLDEPAAGVPAMQSESIFERIRDLPRDLTLLFVEHDMKLVFRFAERISVLVGGRVLTEGTPKEISADERVREVYLGRRSGHVVA